MKLRDKDYSCAKFHSQVLTNKIFNMGIWENCTFDKIHFKHILFDAPIWDRCIFSACWFESVILKKPSVDSCEFNNCVFTDDCFVHKGRFKDTIVPEVLAEKLIVPPTTGPFIAYKRCRDTVVTLWIPESAKRSNATSRKCRASHAFVVDIERVDGKKLSCASAHHHPDFKYRKGTMVHPHQFEEDRWQEYAGGIHFFMTKQEALNYR